MRLIQTTTLKLRDFGSRQVPPYAIFSHTWCDEEMTFQDMNGSSGRSIPLSGYNKVFQLCRIAREQGFDWAWTDTCCIDKSSNKELSDAFNSMFGWYANYSVCFAHLADLEPGSTDFIASRWFTRGWTLQELIAPNTLSFYNQDWKCVETKSDFAEAIAYTTGIPRTAILGPWTSTKYSVATKMSWLSRRQTTYKEDLAYCMLGIFGVTMQIFYGGQGPNAFQRLEEQVLGRSNDLTILAWESTLSHAPYNEKSLGTPLLAPSPSVFKSTRMPDPMTRSFPEFSITNRGLRVSPDVRIHVLALSSLSDAQLMTAIYLGHTQDLKIYLALRKIGPSLFCRHKNVPLLCIPRETATHAMQKASAFNILIYQDSINRSLAQYHRYRRWAISVPKNPELELVDAVPDHLWDPEDRSFLRQNPDRISMFPMVLALHFKVKGPRKQSLILVCCYSKKTPRAGIVSNVSEREVRRLLFRGDKREYSVPWEDFERQGFGVDFGNDARPLQDARGHDVTLSLDPESSQGYRVEVSVASVRSGSKL